MRLAKAVRALIAAGALALALIAAGCDPNLCDSQNHAPGCSGPAPSQQAPAPQGGTVHVGEHCDPAVDFTRDGLTCQGGLTAPPGQADTWQPS